MVVAKLDSVNIASSHLSRVETGKEKATIAEFKQELVAETPAVKVEGARADLGQDSQQSMLRSYPNEGHNVEMILDQEGNVQEKYPPQAVIDKYKELKAMQNQVVKNEHQTGRDE